MNALKPHNESGRTSSGARRNSAVLVTGAGGEMGHGLLVALAEERAACDGEFPAIVAIDLRELNEESKSLCDISFAGDVTDSALLSRLLAQYEISEIYHLAALLSTRSEFVPETAHSVNVGGTINLLRLAVEESRSNGEPVKFFFPSSIAAYGLPNLEEKTRSGMITEDQWNHPHTMYGCNKVSGENLGRYYAHHYRKLASDRMDNPVDFRSIRFPGIISADTVPSGGTSDFGPEMLHAAAQGEPYSCFVRPDARIPFMTMPEAAELVIQAAALGKGKEVFLLDMGDPIKILELAKSMIKLKNMTPFILDDPNSLTPDEHIPILFTGLRPGEKLYEELLINEESKPTEHPLIMSAVEDGPSNEDLEKILEKLTEACNGYDEDEIKRLLVQAGTGLVSN